MKSLAGNEIFFFFFLDKSKKILQNKDLLSYLEIIYSLEIYKNDLNMLLILYAQFFYKLIFII